MSVKIPNEMPDVFPDLLTRDAGPRPRTWERQSLSDQTVAFSLEGVPDERGDRPACPVCRRPVYFLWAKRLFGKDPGVCLYLSDTNEVVSFGMDEERAMGLVEKITAGA